MDKEKLLQMYYEMVLIRRVEERGAELYQAGKIGGFMHLYIGQEAVSTGLISAREPRDRVITAYRDHGVALNCGISANTRFPRFASRDSTPMAVPAAGSTIVTASAATMTIFDTVRGSMPFNVFMSLVM